MEIILKQDIQNLGNKDDIVAVKDGFARNYLIPKGLAMRATKSAKKMIEEVAKQRARKEEKERENAEAIAKKLEKVSLSISTKTSSKGKIFGSVTNLQIAEKLQDKGFGIDRKQVTISEDPIKEIGNYTAEVQLHKDVVVTINFEVVSEDS